MTKPNLIFKTTSVFVLCLLSLTTAFAQTDARAAQAEPSYEVVLQVVVGSNDAAQKNNLPANLAVVTKNLRNNFSFSNYNLSDTYIGRVANTGSIDYKTISGNFGQAQNSQTPVFLDWTFQSLRNAPNSKGQNTIQIQPFRFGARVPVVTERPVTEAGLGTRLEDLISSSQTILAIVLLLVCSLPLVILRRRAMRRNRALDAEHRRARRHEETPV